jgi:hypothetical protein
MNPNALNACSCAYEVSYENRNTAGRKVKCIQFVHATTADFCEMKTYSQPNQWPRVHESAEAPTGRGQKERNLDQKVTVTV